MEFTTTPPRMSALMTARVKLLVPDQCDGWDCEGIEAQFTKRLIAAAVTVHIQCTRCGKSFGALKRAEVYNWQDLPEWDEAVRTGWNDKREEERQARVGQNKVEFPSFEAKKEQFAERQADYRRWLQTSSEWRTLRDRVMRRALFFCEACLGAKASDVHHCTYQLGRLPPAWELRAVCRECHDRLHDWTGGE